MTDASYVVAPDSFSFRSEASNTAVYNERAERGRACCLVIAVPSYSLRELWNGRARLRWPISLGEGEALRLYSVQEPFALLWRRVISLREKVLGHLDIEREERGPAGLEVHLDLNFPHPAPIKPC